jgi:hypothetical protein
MDFPLTLPFIKTKRKRPWITLRLVVKIAIKWKVSVEAVILVIDVLEVLLSDSVIYNILPCV